LHTVANTLGLAIEQNDAEQELRERSQEIAGLAEQLSKLAEDRRRILADALDAEDRTRTDRAAAARRGAAEPAQRGRTWPS
jgi:Asp-tRNA(Asn)/Glu-tRNA(Gln) amidotransferase C subunit